jgi:predicted unusual protein kinase regulating ubiquinone biosynthesis (AarF/ABC1/UbiB family)
MKSQVSSFSSESGDGYDDLLKKNKLLHDLKGTFENFGGVFNKLAQLLSVENGDCDSTNYDDCKPMNIDKTIDFLKNEYITNESLNSNIESIDYNVYKSGSIGQVHKGILKNGDNIIIKVQYVGIEEQILSDLKFIHTIANFIFSFADLTNAIKDIDKKMKEELDYRIESKNQQFIYNIWIDKDEFIKIPEIIPEIISKQYLGIKFIDAESFQSFIKNSTQEEKNFIAYNLVKFTFTNIYKHKCYYSDIHYGNFLIKDKKILYVMDYGCLHYLDDDLFNYFRNIHLSIKHENIDLFYDTMYKIGFIDDTVSDESKNYLYEYIKLQHLPWISKDFHFTEEFFKKAVRKNTIFMREWKIPPNIVYFNKIPYSLFLILLKLNANCNFLSIFDELLIE